MVNGTITARGFGASPGAITFVESNSSGAILFQAVFPSATFFFSGSYTVDINVHVPASAQFGVVRIVTVNGNLQVSGISTSSLTLNDTNGNVSVSGISASSLTILDANGNLDLTCSSCGTQYLTMTTTNGAITSDLSSLSLSGNYMMTATNGNISLKLPATASFKITANVTNGSVSSTGLGVQLTNHVQATVGAGNAVVNLTTTNGSIKVSG